MAEMISSCCLFPPEKPRKHTMLGKYFIFALFAVALVQADDGSSLEEHVKKGLGRLQGWGFVAERGIQATAKDVKYKRDSIELIIENILERAGYHTIQSKNKVEEAAEKAEFKAKDEKKPQATFTCIEKAENATFAKQDTAMAIYEVEAKKFDRYYPIIDAIGRPLQRFKTTIEEQSKKSTAAMKACKDKACVKKVLGDFRDGVEKLDIELKKILQDVDVAFNSKFVRESYGMLNAYARDVNKILENGVKAINSCLTGKFIFGGF